MGKRIMRSFKMDEISAVDRPAQKGAKATILKRDDNGDKDAIYKVKAVDATALTKAVEDYLKREFSADQRKELAGRGEAMPDGAFPIANRSDLRNAVQAIGRAKDPAKAKAHIKARAEAMNATSILPDAWKASKADILLPVIKRVFPTMSVPVAKKFCETIQKHADETDFLKLGMIRKEIAPTLTDEVMAKLNTNYGALVESIDSIFEDDAVIEKTSALEASFQQFNSDIQGVAGGEFEKSISRIFTQGSDGGFMSKVLAKALGLAEDATEEMIVAALTKRDDEAKHLANVAKMSDGHKSAMDKMPEDKRKAFAAMSADDREKQVGKMDADDEVLKMVGGGEIRKSAVGAATFEALKSANDVNKRQADELAIEKNARQVVEFSKRAEPLTTIGKSDEVGALLLDINKFDPKLADRVEVVLKAAHEKIAKGDLLKEHGKNAIGFSKASEGIAAKAAELMKADPKLTIEKARTLVRKNNPDLAKMEEEEAAERKRAA